MTALKNSIVTDVLAEVRVIYLGRPAAKWWNERRDRDEIPAFCGWFWVNGVEEAGPFHTRSAALRDAYYRRVLRRGTPATARAADDMKKRRPAKKEAVHANGRL